jgi:hypothetical protein
MFTIETSERIRININLIKTVNVDQKCIDSGHANQK